MDQQKEWQTHVSVIIVVEKHRRHLKRLSAAAKRIAPKTEVIFVCSPQAAGQVERIIGSPVTIAETASSPMEMGIIGAAQATGNILLFLEDHMLLSTSTLKQYVSSVEKGKDIVLTIYKRERSPHTIAHQLLNHVAGRKDLQSASLCKMPFAVSRSAWQTIGNGMAIPPLAQAQAVVYGLSLAAIRLPQHPSLSTRSRVALLPDTDADPLLRQHVDAIRLLLAHKGFRGGIEDGDRFRQLLQVPGKLHFRSVFRRDPDAWWWYSRRGGGSNEKRKGKRTRSRKKR